MAIRESGHCGGAALFNPAAQTSTRSSPACLRATPVAGLTVGDSAVRQLIGDARPDDKMLRTAWTPQGLAVVTVRCWAGSGMPTDARTGARCPPMPVDADRVCGSCGEVRRRRWAPPASAWASLLLEEREKHDRCRRDRNPPHGRPRRRGRRSLPTPRLRSARHRAIILSPAVLVHYSLCTPTDACRWPERRVRPAVPVKRRRRASWHRSAPTTGASFQLPATPTASCIVSAPSTVVRAGRWFVFPDKQNPLAERDQRAGGRDVS